MTSVRRCHRVAPVLSHCRSLRCRTVAGALQLLAATRSRPTPQAYGGQTPSVVAPWWSYPHLSVGHPPPGSPIPYNTPHLQHPSGVTPTMPSWPIHGRP
ncbi:hypothetical protein ZWY2020_014319 [Hordeum vulgare]|nr:hypothetical protein ZWY2020_014319 [Hordeum vulgare]